MRRLSLACLFAVATTSLVGCGDTVGRPQPAKTGMSAASVAAPSASAPAAPRNAGSIAEEPAPVAAGTPGGPMGALERPGALRRFFEALAKLETDSAQDDVRIVQFGDSHTAADVQTAAARHALQQRFGDGGRGFVAIGRPWSNYLVEGARMGMSRDWSTDKARLGMHPPRDGVYGLSGISILTRHPGARAWTDIQAPTARAELAYLEQPSGGSFDVLVDGVRVVRIATRNDQPTSAFRTFDLAESAPHQIEVRAVGDGEVRVFGLNLDRTQHGVVHDELGINGAGIYQPLAWNEQHFTDQLRHRAPALVVLAYGTNESVDAGLSMQEYEKQLVELLGRVARAVPQASCLLLGPPDRAIRGASGKWVSAPKIIEIVQSQKRVAEAAGCAFYDQMAAMGGEGSMAAWASESPPRAQRDRVHLYKDGYLQLGSSFASDLLRSYGQWRRELGMPVAGGVARAD